MAEKVYNVRILQKQDSTDKWNSSPVILRNGEIGIEVLDDGKKKIKIGDGTSTWANLDYLETEAAANILDGIANGSIRTSLAAAETADYRMGTAAFASGQNTKAQGNFSKATNFNTIASGGYSSAEGRETQAKGSASHAGGYGTIAGSKNQTVIGKFNVEDTSEEYAFIIGDGEDADSRANLFTVAWDGEVQVDGKKLATEEYIQENIPQSDWNQNSETAKDYIKNKPFGEVPVIEPVTWDGLPTNETITVTEIGTPEYKFADVYIPAEDSAGISINANVNGVNYPLQLATSIIHIADQMSSFMFASQEAALVCIITSIAANTVYNGQTITSDSTYGFVQTEGTLNNITLNVNKIKQIDPKFYKDFPGEKTFGEVFTIDGETVIADEGAEIFNSYGYGELTSAERNIATGFFSHAEGYETIASGYAAHAQGGNTVASGEHSHAEGKGTTASGKYAHAEGGGSTASGEYSHAEGGGAVASGKYSHAEGSSTASGRYSHAEGNSVIAASENQHVQGKYNIEDTENTYAHIVGSGAANHRRNIHTLDWNGNSWFKGDVYIGSTSGDNKDEGSKKLATVYEISEQIAAARKVYYAIETDNYGGDIYVNIDNFESYELDTIIFLQFGFDQKSKISTINVNGLGAVPLLSVTTFNTAHTYDVIPKEKDTFVVIYDEYQHFTLLGHLNKDTSYDDLTDDIKALLLPAVTTSNTGQFARVSADGKWIVEAVEIPSIDGLASTTYVDTQDAATLQSAQTYTDTKVANLLNNSTEAVDSIFELRDAMEDNADAIEALTTIAGSKVDKVDGKGLSTNDYTTEEKNKLAGIAPGAEVNVQSDWNATEGDALILNKPTIPTIPTNISAFTNDANYAKVSEIPTKTSQLTNDNGYLTTHQDISGKADKTLENVDNAVFKAKVEASGFTSGTQVQILTWEAND